MVLTVASYLSATARPSVARSALVPALWAGLAAASKYTLGLVFLPVLMGIWMYQEGDRRLVSSGIAVATVCVTFLAAMPYALLDLPAFLNGLAFDAWHYGTAGHVGFNDEPGLTQLKNYANHLTSEFGLFGAVLATIGIVAAFRRDWRRCLLFLAFPGSSSDAVGRSARHFHAECLADSPALRRRWRLRPCRTARMVCAVAPAMEPTTRWTGWQRGSSAPAGGAHIARKPYHRARERGTGFAQPRA